MLFEKKCTILLLVNSCFLIYIILILENYNKETKQTRKQQQPKHHSLKLQRSLQQQEEFQLKKYF